MEEKSLFIEFMGDSPMIRVLDYLLTERDLDFSITDMAENAGIGRATLYRIWGSLIKNGIIAHTRDIGNARLYKLNLANPFARKMADLFDTLVIEPLNKRKKVVVRHN